MPITQRDPELASLGRRLCAGCIDAACAVGGGAAFIGAVAVWTTLRGGGEGEGLEDAMERFPRFAESLGWKRVEPVLALTSAVSRRNWRSIGMYLMHIRRADLRTGGPVTVRSALIRHLAGWGVSRLLSRRLIQPRLKRHQAQAQALQGEVDAAYRRHPDDPQARQQAITQVYRAAGVNPASCCWMPLIPAAVNVLVILGTRRHQSPADRIAGIVLVTD